MREEAVRWLKQADADMQHARASFSGGFYFAVAFGCHQSAEKLLKGAYIELKRAIPPKTHNLVELGSLLGVPGDVMSELRLLNPEYVASRYPDAANGFPVDNYDARKAGQLLDSLEKVQQWVISALSGKGYPFS